MTRTEGVSLPWDRTHYREPAAVCQPFGPDAQARLMNADVSLRRPDRDW